MDNWIDVNDRLPDESTFDVLVAFDEPFFGRMAKECAVCMYDRDTNTWVSEIANKEILRVTHWMPLPEPPKTISNA